MEILCYLEGKFAFLAKQVSDSERLIFSVLLLWF